ncbi:phage tail protein [Trinickia dinghuensis]|uniref:Phage tail protein n=1 Tax=Trinickia dinghuensis TaxID=2291023 RepID=A0A3D8JQH7_9BURK|nr:phage tail protein [Trinickia dinghuensis]RDU95052.1 phage tail protein [Trinickia dinghuensis]
MSAPETTSKGRPSLLSETAPGAPDNSSRILASLEGRVSAQQAPRPRRSKKPLAVAALVVAGLAAAGVWQWQRTLDGGHPAVVAAAGNGKDGKAQSVAGASAATVVNASGAVASVRVAQGVASAPQAAVIVADNTSASSPGGAAMDPLSSALANGAVPSTDKGASTVGVAAASSAASVSNGKPAAGKPAVARTERETAKSRRAEKLAAERRHGKGAVRHDDPDADLLAALVARTEPYDPHAPKSASASKASPAKARPVSLAAQIKQCDKSNFFEAQLCRWRVCSDHWGKDAACPSANAPSTSEPR